MRLRSRIVSAGLAVLVVVVVTFATIAVLWAGTCVQTAYNDYYLQFDWSGNGTITCTSASVLNGQATFLETIPAGSPTTLYDITITNSLGRDIAGNALADLSSTVAKLQKPMLSDGTRSWVPVNSLLTLTVSNNLVIGATGKVRVYYVK